MREFEKALDEDRRLKVGLPVVAHWTNAGNVYECDGTISKINLKSVRVKLTRPIFRADNGAPQIVYDAGFEVVVPRVLSAQWTWNNRVVLK